MRDQMILMASVVFGLASVLRASDITTCGAAGDVGVPQTDLACASEPYGVRLLPGGTLDLNGHHVHAGPQASATVLGVATAAPDPLGDGPGSFTIVGPGEISGEGRQNPLGGTYACVQLNDGRAVVKSDTGIVDIHGCVYGVVGSAGATPNGGRLTIGHASLHDNVFDGIAVKNVAASNVDASNNGGQGIGATATKLVNVTANDTARARGVRGRDVEGHERDDEPGLHRLRVLADAQGHRPDGERQRLVRRGGRQGSAGRLDRDGQRHGGRRQHHRPEARHDDVRDEHGSEQRVLGRLQRQRRLIATSIRSSPRAGAVRGGAF